MYPPSDAWTGWDAARRGREAALLNARAGAVEPQWDEVHDPPRHRPPARCAATRASRFVRFSALAEEYFVELNACAPSAPSAGVSSGLSVSGTTSDTPRSSSASTTSAREEVRVREVRRRPVVLRRPARVDQYNRRAAAAAVRWGY